MTADLPLISILTPCLNRHQFIEEAIQSVLHQQYPNVEHIIIDGGSTDGTVDILHRYPHLHVIREPDDGVWEAVNKGLRRARGEIVGHLNSDDFYAENVFAEVARILSSNPAVDTVFGGAEMFEQRPDGQRERVAQYVTETDTRLCFRNITVGVPVINARFFHKRVYARVGVYDTRYKFASDREFLMRAALAGVRGHFLDRVLYHYRQHAESLTIARRPVMRMHILREHFRIAEQYMGNDGVVSEARRFCRIWHARTATEGIALALRSRRLAEATRCAMRGWRYHKLWPVVCVLIIVEKLMRSSIWRKDESG